ncbi:mannose-6-phosphate isomerase, class I [Photobacterium gaetbulicola]|uniref:Mannose-6-phosphate isomerase n=1 Tax=Photobacterium gaetbulicola Gung47 TaxID=658445 RepID=A0A0C5WCN5_9GAMM|nr:mannose-6-phosphate isomerase, class I [Photobacterium gaetbulicola]AJR09466.1 putative mannose-6-phosphate isomerase [Photobacterium gaetbulicola Gung47]PSU14265.1 mannose-6-phosphate isomerase, class I [Photobacterium gaetbulicola]
MLVDKPFYLLDNVIQNYAWGSKDSFTKLFDIKNVREQPQAELWMGAHPNGCSRIKGTSVLLSDFIEKNQETVLGSYTAKRFGQLPFLFKILAAETPLSIQVHPNKSSAEAGFTRENTAGIELNASNRNYKDSNHKPELVYALTFYRAMNGFRPVEQIIHLFRTMRIFTLSEEINALELNPNSDGLKQFFISIMSLGAEKKEKALSELHTAGERQAASALEREVLQYSKEFSQYYPGDVGLLSPLILNTIELQPGEAMFLHAETPHAYVQGTALEIMANSDNVLRAGLTPKYIDIDELVANTRFVPLNPDSIVINPLNKNNMLHYPIPVDDFGFEVANVTDHPCEQYVRSPEILLCIEGQITISSQGLVETLKPGESLFINYMAESYSFSGAGKLARAFN